MELRLSLRKLTMTSIARHARVMSDIGAGAPQHEFQSRQVLRHVGSVEVRLRIHYEVAAKRIVRLNVIGDRRTLGQGIWSAHLVPIDRSLSSTDIPLRGRL